MFQNNPPIVWCVMGDCSQPTCHHCFPVKNCSRNHQHCQQNGTCSEIKVTLPEDILDTIPSKFLILLTGCAGFIGSSVGEYLLKHPNYKQYHVLGIDNLDPYYDIKVKKKIYLDCKIILISLF